MLPLGSSIIFTNHTMKSQCVFLVSELLLLDDFSTHNYHCLTFNYTCELVLKPYNKTQQLQRGVLPKTMEWPPKPVFGFETQVPFGSTSF